MYYKALGEKHTTSVLTAVDVETGMCMAVQLEDKTQHVQYLSTCLQQFLMECGRTHAILNNTVLQSDQEGFIISLLKMVATAMGSNIAVKQSPDKHKAAWNDSTEHWWAKLGPSNSNWRTTTASSSTASIPSWRGLWNIQHTFSTGTQSTPKATQATTDDGAKNTKHQSVSLVKQFFTCYQQQSTCQRWRQGSIQPSGWVRTPQQTRISLASATKWSKQGPFEDKSNQTSTTNSWWTPSTLHQPWYQ